MARPWIKLHASMLAHPGIGRLSDSSYRAWITMLLMASQSEDAGAIGTVEDVAWQLRKQPEDIETALKELDGKVTTGNGVLRIRDWDEWQAPTTSTERVRRYRERVSSDTGETLQERSGNAPYIEEKSREETEKNGDVSPGWDKVVDWMARHFGLESVTKKNGEPNAYTGRLIGVAGRIAGTPDAACELLSRWRDSGVSNGAWQYVTVNNAAERLAKWHADSSTDRKSWSAFGEG